MSRVDSDDHAASFFRFAAQNVKELRPRCIRDAFRQLRVLDHVAHHQGLDGDQAMLLDQLVCFLMSKVLAAVPAALVNPRDPFLELFSFW